MRPPYPPPPDQAPSIFPVGADLQSLYPDSPRYESVRDLRDTELLSELLVAPHCRSAMPLLQVLVMFEFLWRRELLVSQSILQDDNPLFPVVIARMPAQSLRADSWPFLKFRPDRQSHNDSTPQ